MKYGLYKTVRKSIKTGVNEPIIGVEIQVYPETDFDPLKDQEFQSEKEKEEFLRDLSQGKILHVGIKILAQLYDCEGHSGLGGCFIHQLSELDSIVKEHGLIEEALEELKEDLDETYTKIKTLYEVKSVVLTKGLV